MQKIEIQKLVVPALIGVYDFERTDKTALLVSAKMWADLTPAMASDDVADTIDYGAVANSIKELAGQTSYALIEALGNALGKQLMQTYPMSRLELTIEKPDILPDAQTVGVTFAFDNTGVTSLECSK